MGVIFAFVLLLVAGPVLAQEASLIDILQAKGVLTKKEAQRLKKARTATAGAEQDALLQLLQAKGILSDKDMAQLKSPPTPAVAGAPVAPEVSDRLSRIELQQQALQTQAATNAEQQSKAVEELKKTAVADVKKNIDWLNRLSFFGDIRLVDASRDGFCPFHVHAERLRQTRGHQRAGANREAGLYALSSADADGEGVFCELY